MSILILLLTKWSPYSSVLGSEQREIVKRKLKLHWLFSNSRGDHCPQCTTTSELTVDFQKTLKILQLRYASCCISQKTKLHFRVVWREVESCISEDNRSSMLSGPLGCKQRSDLRQWEVDAHPQQLLLYLPRHFSILIQLNEAFLPWVIISPTSSSSAYTHP